MARKSCRQSLRKCMKGKGGKAKAKRCIVKFNKCRRK